MSPLDTGVPALLLRLDHHPFHHGSLGAVRSLGRAGVEVHAFVESPRGPLARSRYLHRAHPIPGAADIDVERLLLRAAERIGRPAVLLPMDDAGALALASGLADRLRDVYLLPGTVPGAVERAADKAQLAGLCAELGLPHPVTVVPEGPEEVAAAVRELGLPLIAKWSRPWLLPKGSGLRSATVITSAGQALRLYAARARAGSRLLLQRRLAGGRNADWFFHGCFGRGGVPLYGGTGRKDVSWPLGAGATAVGSWRENPEVAAAAGRLAAHLGHHGILDLDFRREAGSGAYHLLDVNPRPGAQFRLFTDPSGLDVVRALHLDLTGRRVPAGRAVPGRMFVAENYGLLAALTAPARVAALRGRPVEAAWFAADDPAPFAAMAGGWTAQVARKGWERALSLSSSSRSPSPCSPAPVPPVPPSPRDAGPGPRAGARVVPPSTSPNRARESGEPRCTTW
ncbi:ATP-grasp domain-containing protein [Streptomyces xiamenensis]|uniref:ATP-grasp domain-containing protein n=1 Tax=Streptomyces xiamenensis TaxID=408015 RepID=UPI0037D631FD